MSCPGVQCRSPAFSVLGPRALCVGARHSCARCAGACSSNTSCVMAGLSLSRARRSLSVSGPGGLSVTRPRTLISVPAALWWSSAVRSAIFVSDSAFLCWPSGPCAFCILQPVFCKSFCMHWRTSTCPNDLYLGGAKICGL